MKKIGIITTITPQKNNLNRFSLFVDGKFISGISYEAIKEANLYVGKELKDKDLKEGMYLEANVPVKSIKDAFEVSRKLLVDDTKLYIVNDSLLHLQSINPVFFNEKTVVIKGLKNGQLVVKEPVPGAYQGMIVKVNSKNLKSNDK